MAHTRKPSRGQRANTHKATKKKPVKKKKASIFSVRWDGHPLAKFSDINK